MKASIVLSPLLDVLAPADVAAAGRRVRNAAVMLALAAWLLPSYPGLGTDTTAHRIAICVPFAVAAVAAQFFHAHRWARVALPVATIAATAIVAWCGGGAMWGLGFGLYAVLVLATAEVVRPRIRLEMPPDEPDPLPPRPRFATRALTWYAWFGISALVVTQWVMQFMFVPTGSMQPTIMGSRLDRLGDALLVDKTRYLFRDPRRWEIVVFEFPLFRERNFVKRVVGLPGEHIEIKDGDIWIDGKIARKPPLVQETMWQEVFPRAVTSSSFGAAKEIQQGWLQSGTGRGEWKRVSDTEVRGKTPGAKDEIWLALTRRIDARDVRLSFDVVSVDGRGVSARINSRGIPVELGLSAGAESLALLSVGGRVVDYQLRAPLDPNRVHRVELTVLDGEAWWSLDGKEHARGELPAGGRGDTRVEIGASGDVTFRNLRVESDVHYKAGDLGSAWDVPADGYFFLGDNVAGSDDSRRWSALLFRPAGGGPTVTAAATVPDEMGRPRNQIRIEGGMQHFTDVDGVPRALPSDTPYESIPFPFARRSHIVGRAVMVVFPWTVAEAGFRPRFLP